MSNNSPSTLEKEAADTLGFVIDANAVESLIVALKDKSGRIRSEAASSLGAIKDQRAVEPLIETLEDRDTAS